MPRTNFGNTNTDYIRNVNNARRKDAWDMRRPGRALEVAPPSRRRDREVRTRYLAGDPIQQLAVQPQTGTGDILEQIAQQYYADAMQGASAIGQQMGQSFNRRGLGNSPLAAGLQSQAMNQALGRAQSEVAKMRLGYAQHQDALQRQDQSESDSILLQLLSLAATGGFKVADKMGWFDKLFDGVNLSYDSPEGFVNFADKVLARETGPELSDRAMELLGDLY